MGTKYAGRHDWHIGAGGPLNTPSYSARVDEICGTKSADIPAKLGHISGAWNPRKVLLAAFGGNAEAAYATCYGRALGQESLKEAVAIACLWAVEYGYRYGQSVADKPGNFVRQSLPNAFLDADHDGGIDLWQYGQKGDNCRTCHGKGNPDGIDCETCDGTGKLTKRKWMRAYCVSQADAIADDEGNEGETTALDDPGMFAPQGSDTAYYYRPSGRGRRLQAGDETLYRDRRLFLWLVLEPELYYLAEGNPDGVEAFRAVYMHDRTLDQVAAEQGVNKSTVKRRADKVYREIAAQHVSHGRLTTGQPARLSAGAQGHCGRSGGRWYGTRPAAVLDGIKPHSPRPPKLPTSPWRPVTWPARTSYDISQLARLCR